MSHEKPAAALRCGAQGYKSYIERGEEPPRTTSYRKRLAAGVVIPKKKWKTNTEDDGEGQSTSTSTPRAPPKPNELLYPTSRITLNESLAILLNLAQRHPSMNQELLKDVLWAMEMHLPKDVDVRHLQSVYKFSKFKEVGTFLFFQSYIFFALR